MPGAEGVASDPRHNWLATLIPADARRFHVDDAKLGGTLAHAGAELTEARPDVEIVSDAGALLGNAPYAIVTLGFALPEGGSRLVRACRRAAGSLRARAQAIRSRRTLRRRGYPETFIIPWEWQQAVRLPWVRPRSELAWNERFPLDALVVGSRRGRPPTVLDAALAQAGEQLSVSLEPEWPLATQAGLVVIAPTGVLRVAIGPALQQLERQRDVLATLDASSPVPDIAGLVPWLLAEGKTGLAYWSLERRLPGSLAPSQPSGRLLQDCVDFLVALNGTGDNSVPKSSPARDAGVIARACDPEGSGAVQRLGSRVEAALAEVPRVFVHGDFWSRNLLAESGRLVGVVDWENGGPGRLPLLDLLQLQLNAVRSARHQFLGPALIEYLLPWAQAGGDELARGYAGRIGIEATPSLLETFVLAYWLDRVGHELETCADRMERPLWMRQNVELVIDAVAQGGLLDRPPPPGSE